MTRRVRRHDVMHSPFIVILRLISKSDYDVRGTVAQRTSPSCSPVPCDGSGLKVSLRGLVHKWFLARNVPMGLAEVCMPSRHINMGTLSEVSPVYLSD